MSEKYIVPNPDQTALDVESFAKLYLGKELVNFERISNGYTNGVRGKVVGFDTYSLLIESTNEGDQAYDRTYFLGTNYTMLLPWDDDSTKKRLFICAYHWDRFVKGLFCIVSVAPTIDLSKFPHKCLNCGSPAYYGFSMRECSKGCK